MTMQNLKNQTAAYQTLIFGKGHSTSQLNLSQKEVYSLLAENEKMLKRFHNHGFTTMEKPFIDKSYFTGKTTCIGILVHNFFVKVKSVLNSNGDDDIKAVKTPCYRHALKFSDSDKLKTAHTPFFKKTKKKELHETIIPSEYVFIPFDKDGNLSSDLVSIYRGTKPGTEEALHKSYVSIKYGLSANSNQASSSFFEDPNIKRTILENLIDGRALFEVHAVGLVYHGYADHNRMVNDRKELIYPKPNPQNGEGYVHFFNVSAAMMGIKLHQRSFHDHAGASHVLKQGQKELQESNIDQFLTDQDKEETEKLFNSYREEDNTSSNEDNSSNEEETQPIDNAAEEISDLMPEDIAEEPHVLKKGNIQSLVGTKYYELLEELEENDFYSFLLFMMDELYKPLINLACEAKEEIEFYHIVQLNGAVFEFLRDLRKKKESPNKIKSFKKKYSSLEDIKEVLDNTLSSGEFDMDDLEDKEEDKKTSSNSDSASSDKDTESKLEPKASAPSEEDTKSEPEVDISLRKRVYLFDSVKEELGLEGLLNEVDEPSLKDLDYLVKAIHSWIHQAGMETSFSKDEISNVKDESSFQKAGIEIIEDVEEIDADDIKPFSKGINSFEELKAYVDNSNSSEEESSNEPDYGDIEQASEVSPELMEELEQIANEGLEEEEQESNDDNDFVDGNNVDPNKFFSQ